MGLAGIAVGVALVLSLVRGGRFGNLEHARLRGTWLVVLGFAMQALTDLAVEEGALGDDAGLGVLLSSFVLIVAWLAMNRHLRGTILVLLGFALNAIVIAANGAMPVDIEAIRAAGITAEITPIGKHEVMTDATLLPWLADRYPIVPIKTTISIGDVVLAAGMIPLVHDLLTSSSPVDRRRALRREPVTTG